MCSLIVSNTGITLNADALSNAFLSTRHSSMPDFPMVPQLATAICGVSALIRASPPLLEAPPQACEALILPLGRDLSNCSGSDAHPWAISPQTRRSTLSHASRANRGSPLANFLGELLSTRHFRMAAMIPPPSLIPELFLSSTMLNSFVLSCSLARAPRLCWNCISMHPDAALISSSLKHHLERGSSRRWWMSHRCCDPSLYDRSQFASLRTPC